jgi:glyoxylase-like metal-dependent hydrolase (beta-lactamase superfamily II)
VDAPAVADHRVLATEVYGQRDEERIAALIKRCGANVVVTERYEGGEIIDLGGLSLQVIHAPGHTAGNISLYDPAERALVHGESVMGSSQVNEQGLRSTPFGADPVAYRRTLEALLGLEVELFLSSHRAPLDGAGGREAMRDSLASLEEYEAACRAALGQGACSVEELVTVAAEQGHYQGGPRLQQQVSCTLQGWLREGVALGAPAEGYRLAR